MFIELFLLIFCECKTNEQLFEFKLLLMKQAKIGWSRVHFTSARIKWSVAQKFYACFKNLSDGFYYPCKNYVHKLLLIGDIGP